MPTYQEVYDIYLMLKKRDGKASCDKVAAYLYDKGVKPRGYDQPYSRQRIRCILSEQPEGRALIQRDVKRRPVIVEDRQGVIEWLQAHNLADVPIVSPKDVSVKDVKNAYVYGDIPVSLAKFARSVWLVTTPTGQPIVADLPYSELEKAKAELREVKIKVVQ